MPAFALILAAGFSSRMTPHFKPMRHNASPEKIAGLISRIEEVLRREEIDIQLYTGNEIYYHSEAVLKIEEKRKKKI